MRRVLGLALVLALAGCKVHNADPTEESGQLGGERCANIQDMSDAMHCELAPYMSGTLHDEAAFRKALEQVRDLGPSDPAFFPAQNGWAQITQTMLDTKQYKQGCGDCHKLYRKPYKAKYSGTQIPWNDVHAAPTAAATPPPTK
ncbi:MAG: hypothetical protein JST54_05505 [Deltaproteobacteria bacterium]|nr:hypothetical protein [Deltaproteobacteria bacterium]